MNSVIKMLVERRDGLSWVCRGCILMYVFAWFMASMPANWFTAVTAVIICGASGICFFRGLWETLEHDNWIEEEKE